MCGYMLTKSLSYVSSCVYITIRTHLLMSLYSYKGLHTRGCITKVVHGGINRAMVDMNDTHSHCLKKSICFLVWTFWEVGVCFENFMTIFKKSTAIPRWFKMLPFMLPMFS